MFKFIALVAVLALASTASAAAPPTPYALLKKNKNFSSFVKFIDQAGLTKSFSKPLVGMLFVPDNKAITTYINFARVPAKTQKSKAFAVSLVKAHLTSIRVPDYKKIGLKKGVTLKTADGGAVFISRPGNNLFRITSKRDPFGSFLLGGPVRTGKFIIQQIAGVQGTCTTPQEFINSQKGFYNYKKLVSFLGKRTSPFSKKTVGSYLNTNAFVGTVFIPTDAAFNAFFPTVNATKIESVISKLGVSGSFGLVEAGILPGTRVMAANFPAVPKAFKTPITAYNGWELLVGKTGIFDFYEKAAIKVVTPNLLACHTLIHTVNSVIQPDTSL